MSRQVIVPALGESVVEATVGEWLVQEGQAVKTGDILVRLETDKVDLEVSAEQDGVIGRILRRKGEDVKVGDPLAEISGGTETAAPPAPAAAVADSAIPRPSGESGEQTSHDLPLPPSQAAAAQKPGASEGSVQRPGFSEDPAQKPGFSEKPGFSDAGDDGEGRISPLARRVAEERGVDL